MRKALVVSGIVLLAACIALPYACWKIDSEKESVIIIEEPLWGDPAAAEDITLQVASCLDDYMNFYMSGKGWNLRWDTIYTIGSGEEAESAFEFSSRKAGQIETPEEKYIECVLRQSYGTAYTNNPMPEIIFDVAERTTAGEERQEIVHVSDYYEYYPIEAFRICGEHILDITSTTYGYSNKYLTEFFHIPTGEDTAEVAMKKNEKDDITHFHLYIKNTNSIPSASAIGEKGCYYVYCCTDEDGNYMDIGQNKGIFYIPCMWENDGRNIVVDWEQIRKVCDQPEGAIPVKLMLDEVHERLFLVLRDEREFQLAIYTIEGEVPVFVQQIPVLAGYEGEDGVMNFSCFRQMTVEEGGILLTWQDNTFSFVSEENGQYRLWCGGKFPVDGKGEEILAQGLDGGDELRQFLETRSSYKSKEYYDIRQNIQDGNESFTVGNACYFDGDRLVLAAMSTWESTDVLLSVYHDEGLAYCGLYKLSEADPSYRWLAQAYVAPQRYGEKECIRLQGHVAP